MFERMKSIVLVVLVAMSFYLTYQLWWDNPSYETWFPAEYEAPNVLGSTLTWNKLLQPQHVLFHYEQDKHTKATMGTSIYQMLWDSLQKWQFMNAKEISIDLTDGRKLFADHNSLEFVFADDFPIPYYAEVLHLPSNIEHLRTFNRIWVYEAENDTYKALFISDKKRRVIETTLLDFEEGRSFSVRNLTLLGSQLTEVIPASFVSESSALGMHVDFFNVVYVPLERGYMNQWTYPLTFISIEDMANALLLDRTSMKEIPEREHSRIVTDGTKSLRYHTLTSEMRLYLPTYEQGIDKTAEEEMYPILDFMNQHHGWTGDFLLERRLSDPSTHGIVFREYFSGYPIYSEGSAFGEITIKLSYYQVNEYIRSLIRLQSAKSGYQIPIKSGAELLLDLQAQHVYLYNVRAIQLGYQATLRPAAEELDLIPYYIVQFHKDRAPLYIDARAQKLEE